MNSIGPRSSLTLAAAGYSTITLRRCGTKPLRFCGRLVARHDGSYPSATLWHEIAFYAVDDGGWATEIVARHADACSIIAVRNHASLFETLDDAINRIETYNAIDDVCPGFGAPDLHLDDPTLPPALLALQAAALERFCHDIARRYRSTAGTLLASLAWLPL